jgi:hypothetical protein
MNEKTNDYFLKLSLAVQPYKEDIVKILLTSKDGLSKAELREKVKCSEMLFDYHFEVLRVHGVIIGGIKYRLNFEKTEIKKLRKLLT